MGETEACTGGGRLQELDVLRGFAATWVVLFHFSTRYGELFGHPNPLPVVVTDGFLPVHLFFMISGFVIFMTLQRVDTLADFVVSRVSRLYPPYWAGILVTLLAAALIPPPGGTGVSAGQVLVNLTMLQAYLYVPHVDGVYWSLAWELGFYTVMGGLLVAGLLRHIRVVALVWLAAGALSHLFPDLVWHRVGLLLVLNYAHLFLAGIFFYFVWKDQAGAFEYGFLALCLACDLLMPYVGRPAPFHTLVLGGFFLLFFLAVTGRMRFLSVRPLLFLGSISYSLYLIHQNVGYGIMKAMYDAGARWWEAIPVALLATVALAAGMGATVERPATRRLRHLYLRWKSERTAVPVSDVGGAR